MARATVSPPTPESKIPIGASAEVTEADYRQLPTDAWPRPARSGLLRLAPPAGGQARVLAEQLGEPGDDLARGRRQREASGGNRLACRARRRLGRGGRRRRA